MSNQTAVTVQKIIDSILEVCFFFFYWGIKLLIFIGEWTQRILLMPFLMTFWLYRSLIAGWEQFIGFWGTIGVRTIEIAEYTPLSPEHLDPPEEPVEKSPTNITLFLANAQISFRHFIRTTTLHVRTFSGIALTVSIRALKGFIRDIPENLVVIFRLLRHTVKKIAKVTYESIISTWQFLTSTYFKFFVYGFIACFLVVLVYQSYLFIMDLPSPRSIGKINFAQSTHLYDRNGKLLYEIYHDINRTSVKIDELPPYVSQATIAIEDKHFYNHKGISFFGGILRAFKDTLKTNELQGGSTITQQLVKSALLSPERTVERKVKEIALALWTEQIYSKKEIMEMYLNQVPYGGSSYGIEEAAKIYFGKSAKYLTLPEAALLAGLPRAPSIYSPFVNKELAHSRRNEVLNQMFYEGYISKLERDVALKTDLNLQPVGTNIRAPHFVFFTKTYLENEYGSKQVEEGGFNVQTTLDLDIQQKSEQILKEELAKIKNLNVSNGGIIVMKPDTGEILAMVGSVDYFSGDYGAFNVTTAERQPGSALKPMLYALALQRGFTAATRIDDSPIVFQVPGGEAYNPVNYDGRYHGSVPIRYALSNSYNIPAVKVLNVLGVQSFVDFAREMGIDTWRDTSGFGLSLGLGGGEVTLLDLAQVYGVFASGGYRIEPSPVRKIVDSKERIVDELNPSKARVIDDSIAYIITDILSDNIARQQAFGPNSALEIKGHTVSVKTGTTDSKKDNLTVGYTPEYLVAVWVGNNDNTPMNPYLTSGITGAAPIWNRVMKYLIENKSHGVQFKRPYNIVGKPCYGGGKEELFVRGTESTSGCFDSVIKPHQAQNPEARNN